MRVLVIHFRSAPAGRLKAERVIVDPLDSAGTDGVSLEIAKRQATLEAMGHTVAICSAYDWADFPIPALEFDTEGVSKLVRNLFGPGIVDFANETELRGVFDTSRLELKQRLRRAMEDFAPNLIFVHNILSLPVHPVATVSLAELLEKTGVPCAAIHHDILSEGAYEFTPTCNFAKSVLGEYFPPRMPNIRHWTINMRNRRSLAEKGVDAEVIHDTMDFKQKLEPEERTRIRVLLRAKYDIGPSDVVLFVGARIVPNKQTELAGHLTAVLESVRHEMVGKTLYHGGVFSDRSRIILLLAGRSERGFIDYRSNLFELLNTLEIAWRYVGDDVRPFRAEDEGLYALYPDWYAVADFVLYPTGWEGFGNQLLEAIAADVPVAVFEYPVFKEDIAPKDVRVVSLGDTLLPERDYLGLVQIPPEVLGRAAREMMAILTNPEEFQRIASHNISVGKEHFGFDVLRTHLCDAVCWAESHAVGLA
ncbi:hypothetical protein ACFLXE_04275 [Chloroflexota bacterium]